MSKLLVIGFSFGYLVLLFGVAYAAERRSAARKSLVSNPYVYALSMAVYCTAWTYYGSVGRAAHNGLEFVGIYLGPTLLAPVWWLVLRKIIRVSRQQRLTSIADFISARYGKSAALGALVTVVCVLGIVPYIALQIKAIAASFVTLTGSGAGVGGPADTTALYTTGALAVFTILFGVRSVEATERHEGIVLAVAVESVLKLVAFLVLGAFVTFGLFHGFTDVFDQAAAVPALRQLFTLRGSGTGGAEWFTLLVLSMSAILLLPRQFQVAVVENVDENHLRKAMWLFPLYLIIINLFVLPVAFGGMLKLGHTGIDADTYVLALPLAAGHSWLALLTYLGGLSAASSMIIVETIALSVMMSNHLLMPLLVRVPSARPEGQTRWFAYLGRVALESRRLAVVLVLLLAYGYYAEVGKALPLVNTGLVSFRGGGAVCARRAGRPVLEGRHPARGHGGPAGGVCGVVFYAGAAHAGGAGAAARIHSDRRRGRQSAACGRLRCSGSKGSITSRTGCSGAGFSTSGSTWASRWPGRPRRWSCGRPMCSWTCSRAAAWPRKWPAGRAGPRFPTCAPCCWASWGRSAPTRPCAPSPPASPTPCRRSKMSARQRPSPTPTTSPRPTRACSPTPKSCWPVAWARPAPACLVASVAGAEQISYDSVVGILKESQQLLEANRQLQKQSRQLQRLTDELRAAYDQLQALDHRKDEFLYTVTHELRTPLTSIRALAEILADNPDLEEEERLRFQLTIGREAERLTRLISLVLDLEKFESGQATLDRAPIAVAELVAEALDAVGQLLRDKHIALHVDVPADLPVLLADRDRLMQVLVNLLSNAIKACRARRPGPHRGAGLAHRRRAPAVRGRQRPGHLARRPAPHLRQVLPGPAPNHPQARRHRPGPGHHPQNCGAAPRPHLGREQPGAGRPLLHRAAADARRAREEQASLRAREDRLAMDL